MNIDKENCKNFVIDVEKNHFAWNLQVDGVYIKILELEFLQFVLNCGTNDLGCFKVPSLSYYSLSPSPFFI